MVGKHKADCFRDRKFRINISKNGCLGSRLVNKLNSPIDHLLVNILPVLAVVISSHLWVEVLKANASNIHATPHSHCGNMSVSADNVYARPAEKTTSKISPIGQKMNREGGVIFRRTSVPLESPCSPMIQPWQLEGWMWNFSPMRWRKRALSRLVPEPMTRWRGKPLSFHAT